MHTPTIGNDPAPRPHEDALADKLATVQGLVRNLLDVLPNAKLPTIQDIVDNIDCAWTRTMIDGDLDDEVVDTISHLAGRFRFTITPVGRKHAREVVLALQRQLELITEGATPPEECCGTCGVWQ